MSGWIKMGTGLGSHPKVKAMCRSLKADKLRVVGGLWAVWCVFDEHSADGRLDGYTLADMDDEIGWRGFSSAMHAIGWLLDDGDGLEAPDYEVHNGPNAKRRALDASRKGKTRNDSAHQPDESPQRERTPVRSESGQMSASDADKTRNREEKRREEGIPSGANAPAAAAAGPPALAVIPTIDPKPLTAREKVWSVGVALLGEAARPHLGKLAKTYGEELLSAVLAEAMHEQPVDPKAWVIAACERRKSAAPAKANGHAADPIGEDADWAHKAGFPNRWAAENEGCYHHNWTKFRDGRRVDA